MFHLPQQKKDERSGLHLKWKNYMNKNSQCLWEEKRRFGQMERQTMFLDRKTPHHKNLPKLIYIFKVSKIKTPMSFLYKLDLLILMFMRKNKLVSIVRKLLLGMMRERITLSNTKIYYKIVITETDLSECICKRKSR